MNPARAVLTLAPVESDLPVLAPALTVSVPIVTIVTTMTPPMRPRVATIRILPTVRPAVAILAAVRPAVVVLSRGVAQSQAAETENHQRTEHYRSLNFHIAPSSELPCFRASLTPNNRLSKRGLTPA
jgi:hypothetical protein